MRLSDSIEQFIKTLIRDDCEAEFRRNELAQYFNCAPSQINYVLATRFTPAHGYQIESQRGGGGCIRIFRMKAGTGEELQRFFHAEIGDRIDETGAFHIITALREREIITDREAEIMHAALSQQAFGHLPLPIEMKDTLRASILKQMLLKAAKGQTAPDKGAPPPEGGFPL